MVKQAVAYTQRCRASLKIGAGQQLPAESERLMPMGLGLSPAFGDLQASRQPRRYRAPGPVLGNDRPGGKVECLPGAAAEIDRM